MTESLPPEDPRDALIRELTARVSELTAQVAELREQLGAARRAAPGNLGNSSLPPSGDDQPRRQPRRERRPQSGRRRSGRGKRAATSLARLWHAQGRTQQARAMLGNLLGSFREGRDTADLITTRDLLGQPGPSVELP